MPALTSDIAEFVTSVEVGALPEQCSYGARIGMVDCVGVMIAGASEPVVRLVTTTIATSTQNEGAPEIPSGRNLAATDAALVNGVAAHALDYDDVGMDSWPKAGRSTSAAATRSQPM
jgi:2-methylcitrate dehydratase PrpD